MRDLHRETIETYDQSAEALMAHYDEIGPRAGDVMLGFALANNPDNARVLEIGCGYGREAREIMRHTPYYTGIDAATTLIQQARQRVPQANFEVADVTDYDFSETYDIVFAFASLRHLDQTEVQTVLGRIHDCLQPGGIVYLSLNYGETYERIVRRDEFGSREIYLYNPRLIQKLAGPRFKPTYGSQDTIGGVEWFEIALRKPLNSGTR